jgi:hypothetical protein
MRDRAILSVGLQVGLRRAEIASLSAAILAWVFDLISTQQRWLWEIDKGSAAECENMHFRLGSSVNGGPTFL